MPSGNPPKPPRPVKHPEEAELHESVDGFPKVSVVIPTHNRSALLRRTLQSVVKQTGVDLEVVVVDDGSSDDTAAMVLGLGEPRIRLERHRVALGVSAARNRGIALARGEWVAFLDDDDLWAPNKLSSQIAAADRQARVWAYSGTVVVTPSLQVVAGGPPPPPEEVSRWLAWRNMVRDGASNVIVRRKVLEQAGGFDTGLRHMSDWDLWIRLAKIGPPAVVVRPQVAYVLHPGNASIDTKGIPAELRVVEKRYSELRSGAPADRAYVFRWTAWNSLRTGNRGAAIRAYLQAAYAGDLRSLARIVVALVDPGVARRGYGRNQADREWKAAAEAWLEDFTSNENRRASGYARTGA